MRHLATRSARVRRLLAAALTTAAALAMPSAADAAFLVNVTDAAPTSTEASAYSDFTLAVTFPQDSTPRDLDIDLPQGQLGVLNAAQECPAASFRADACNDASRIGGVSVVVHTDVLGDITAPGSISRIPATGTEAGRIGIVVRPPVGDKMFLEGTLRVRDDGSYGIRASVHDMPKTAKLTVPGLGSIPLAITVESMRMVMYGRVGQTGSKGFFFNPADCVEATSVVSAVAWDGQQASGSASYTPANCAGVPFTPSVSFSPSPSAAATPVPFTVTVSQPFDPAAAKIGAPIRETRLVLPDGVQLTGASDSDGKLAACTDAQFHLTDLLPSTCPAGAKVGTVVLDSPLVGPVNGDVFLAQPASGPNDLIRLFVVAQRGNEVDALRVKLLTRVEVDPSTGRLVNTLVDLPAQPVNSLKLSFRGGTAPGVRQPRTCGTYTGSASLTPFSSPSAVHRTGSYVVASNCPASGRFRPTASMELGPAQAGATTAGTTTFDLPIGDEPLASITTHLPAGLLANIAGIRRCTVAQADAGGCPDASKVGSVESLAGQSTVPGRFTGSVWLTDAPDAQSVAGLFVKVPVKVGPIFVGDITTLASLRLRPDYGIDVIAPVPLTIRGIALDQQRLRLVLDRPGFMVAPPTCDGNVVRTEFGSALGTPATATGVVAVTGCDQLGFAPAVRFSASSPAPGAASALTTTVEFPASTDAAPQSPASQIAVQLPEGVSLSASAGAGGDLVACSDAQFSAGTLTAPACPAGSAIGTVSIDTPTVGHLTGTAYLATGGSDHLARMLLDARADDFGPSVRVKVVGSVDVDAATGATTATFDGLPPVTFTRFSLTTRGGDSPVIALPRTCGTFAGGATFTSLAGAAVRRDASLTVDQGCTAGEAFGPRLAVSTSTTQAAADTTLSTVVETDPAGPELRSLDLAMPPGLLGRLTVAAQCPLEAARADQCGEDSLVGSIEARAGVRGAPFTVRGQVHLTAGSGDAIAGLAFSLPARVGPIDLGTVVTLAELRLTPGDLRLQITAPDVPTRVRGVRLDLQRLAISVDRPGMVVNPTSCGAGAGSAIFGAAQGASSYAEFGYQPTGCEALAWRPTLAVAFRGAAADLAVKGHPTITTVIEMPRGQGNLRTADVTLPEGVSTDLKSINARVCPSATDASAGTCSPASQIGSGQIETSALPRPVSAQIILVKLPGQVLPGIALRIRDQISFDLVGTTKITPQGRLRVFFDGSPDAPIDRLTLTFVGGDGGVVQLGADLCANAKAATDAALTSQSGATTTVKVPVDCGTKVQSEQAGSASARLTLRPQGPKRGLTLVVRATSAVNTVKLTLPSGLAFSRSKAAAKAVRVTKPGGKRAKATVSMRGSAITVKVKTRGVTRLQVVVPAKATRFRASYARILRTSRAQRKVKPRLTVKDASGTTFAPKPVLRFSSTGSR